MPGGRTNLVGHCVQMLPLRTAVDPHAAIAAQMRAAREALVRAFEHQAATFDPLLVVQKEVRIQGCFYGSFRPKLDFLRYVDMVVKGQLKVKELISRRYRLDEINEAYDRLGRGEVARSVISFPV